jgi:hypothetical protein
MRPLITFLTLCLAFILTACSDDTTTTHNGTNPDGNNGGTPTCPDGERYNVVLGRCQPVASNNNNNNNNPADMTISDMTISDMPVGQDMPDPDMGGVDMDRPDQMYTEQDVGVCGLGSVKGRACAPSGEPVANATVTITGTDCRTGQPFTRTLTTDRNGSYEANDLPSGGLDITVSTGGSFNRSFYVTLLAGEQLDLTTQTSKYCLEANAVKIAVIGGLFDHVEGVLDDLAFDYDMKGNDIHQNDLANVRRKYPNATADLAQTVAFLSNLNALEQYDIIFINCGILWDSLSRYHMSSLPTIISNLYNFVDRGGGLYVADWAHAFAERVRPDMIDFYGNDDTPTAARNGWAPQTIQASVLSQGLQNALGANSVAIEFPQDAANNVVNIDWVVAQAAGMSSTVHLQGNARLCTRSFGECAGAGSTLPNAPLLVSHRNSNGGTIVFTAFHNERQHAVAGEILTILKFLIFQL